RTTNLRSTETVQALLDLADADHVEIDQQGVDLADIVAQSLGDAAPDIEQHGLELRCDLGDARLLGDPVLLRLMVSNLIANAVRHNVERGWISIVTHSEPTAADPLTARREPGERHRARAVLVVKNSGQLIAEESLTTLTEPFQRGRPRVRAGHLTRGGHGLGLALVNSIITAHDGTLRLNPVPTGGLAVTAELPADGLIPHPSIPQDQAQLMSRRRLLPGRRD
ncbi:MAG: two-component system, OmpR family, sensor histidine kinase VanS, partial [Pseudonocardiales bacterium]|nr:two-component system, OmpR family, sensor histidine kinase VanS [Pseudonocardiales bacterium]